MATQEVSTPHGKIYVREELSPEQKKEREQAIRTEYEHCHTLFNQKDFESAFNRISTLITNYPLISPDFYTLRAAIHQSQGRLKEAYEDLKRSTEIPNGDKLVYHWNCIKIMNQIPDPTMNAQAEAKTWKLLKQHPEWEEGYYFLFQRLLSNITLEKYITARNLFKQYKDVVQAILSQLLLNPERLEKCRNWFFAVGRMNIHFWFEENAMFILEGLCLGITIEEQVQKGLRKSTDTPLVWAHDDGNFVENAIRRCLELQHPELPLFIFIQVDCFPLSNEDITKGRIVNDRNLQIMQRVYQEKNIHYTSFKDLVTAVPQALTYYYAYHNKPNAGLFLRINDFYRAICPDLGYVAPWLNEKGTPKEASDVWRPGCGRKLRIAFISKYLASAHSVLRDRSGIILNIYHKYKADTEIMYYVFDKPESLGQNLASQIPEHQVLPRDITEQRKVIGEAKHDILVFCEIGMDVFTYFLAFGRYAPCQIDTWGHSDTSGQRTIDYYYSSAWYDTEESAQKHYSEKLVRMKSLCTFYHDPLEWVGAGFQFKTREEYGFSKENNIYYCCQSIFKVSPDFDRILREILFRDPYAVIIIIDSYGLKDELLKKRWVKKMGAHMSRIHFVNKMPFAEFLNVMKISDILLDSYPFGGCNSSMEAFRLGKIVITLPGNMLNGRFTLGFYNKMGITDPIATSVDDYIDKSLLYGTNQTKRRELEQRILQKYNVLFYEQDSIHEWRKQMELSYLERTQ
jgi:hypothetical protein